MNSATQIMSSMCQNRLKQTSRRMMAGRKPLKKTWAIMVPSHSKPTVTWQAVAADHGEKGRQERAALGRGALRNHGGEIVRFEQQERKGRGRR